MNKEPSSLLLLLFMWNLAEKIRLILINISNLGKVAQ